MAGVEYVAVRTWVACCSEFQVLSAEGVTVGMYSEYLDRDMSFQELTEERKRQLRRISDLRGGRDILVYAADLGKPQAPIAIAYGDLLPISDQLYNLSGSTLDIILETPGGSGEVAEDFVRLVRKKYNEVAVIVPGWAKSAGTIVAMAADEILMEPASALGPIDAQLSWQGKTFSADALIKGFEKIKEEVTDSGALNRAFIPILQGISPGELQSAQNALDFASQLVTDWLVRYKFKNWTRHSNTNEAVTQEEKENRAKEIATELCKHSRWLTHQRSIKLDDLESLKLVINDYSQSPELADAIRRYYTLLQITFGTNIYKVFETATSQVYRFIAPQVPIAERTSEAAVAIIKVECAGCKKAWDVQLNLGKRQPLRKDCLPFPADNTFTCPHCAAKVDLSNARRQIEMQTKKPVVID